MNVWKILVPTLILGAVSTGALAQGGGFGTMTPQQMQVLKAKGAAWQKWRENHKFVESLGKTMIGMMDLDKNEKTALSKDQAKQVLAIVKPWRNKPNMTDDEAKKVNKQLNDLLTLPQLQKKEAMQSGKQGGGGGFGGGARPGAGGGGQFDPMKLPDPKDFNPLNPDSSPFMAMNPKMATERKQAYDEFLAKLAKK